MIELSEDIREERERLDSLVNALCKRQSQADVKTKLSTLNIREKVRIMLDANDKHTTDAERLVNTTYKSLTPEQSREYHLNGFKTLSSFLINSYNELVQMKKDLEYYSLYVNSSRKERLIYERLLEDFNLILPFVKEKADSEPDELRKEGGSYNTILSVFTGVRSVLKDVDVCFNKETSQYEVIQRNKESEHYALKSFKQSYINLKSHIFAFWEWAKEMGIEDIVPQAYIRLEEGINKDYSSINFYSKTELNRIIKLKDHERTPQDIATLYRLYNEDIQTELFPDYNEVEIQDRLIGENNVYKTKWTQFTKTRKL